MLIDLNEYIRFLVTLLPHMELTTNKKSKSNTYDSKNYQFIRPYLDIKNYNK